jgi:2-dehydropantoate 2-reductase
MQITVVGSGAMGGLMGAYLTMQGQDVLLVDVWQEHVDALNTKGLSITGIRGPKHVTVKSATPDQLSQKLELVLLATKSHHTDQAVRGLLPFLGPDSLIVSLQNGFNVDRIAEHVPLKQIIGTVPNYGGALVAPGHLEFVHEGPLHIGEVNGLPTDRIQNLQRLFSCLTETEVSENIVGEIWGKQIYFSMITLTALVDAPIGEILRKQPYRLMGGALVKEALQLANLAGIALPASTSFDPQIYNPSTPSETQRFSREVDRLLAIWSQHNDNATHLVKKGSGVWWDIVYRKRKSETTGLSGAVVEKARRLGLHLPANERLVQMVYEIEDQRRELGWHNLEELRSYMNELGIVLPTNEEEP